MPGSVFQSAFVTGIRIEETTERLALVEPSVNSAPGNSRTTTMTTTTVSTTRRRSVAGHVQQPTRSPTLILRRSHAVGSSSTLNFTGQRRRRLTSGRTLETD